MKTIIINEKQWLRGTGCGLLENSVGERCCLGFACDQLGFKDLKGSAMPEALIELIPGLTETDDDGDIVDSDFSDQASRFNDDPNIDDEERKFWLKILAKDAGFIFKFE